MSVLRQPLFFHGPLDGRELSPLSRLNPATLAVKANWSTSSINLSPHKVVHDWSMGRIGQSLSGVSVVLGPGEHREGFGRLVCYVMY